MFNIYDMLKSGMSADEIAAQFTQNLNDAENRIKTEEAEEARLAEEAVRAEQERIDATAAMEQEFEEAIGNLMRTIARHYPELGVKAEEITDESIAATTSLVLMLLDLKAMKNCIKVEVKNDKPATLKEVPVDPFVAFFNQFGL